MEIDRPRLKWCAFMMVHNEEEMVADAVSCIRNQTIPPTRIHVLNDGSTDSTCEILNSMNDVIVTNVPAHPPQHSDPRFTARKYQLMHEAARDTDYILGMDADVDIPSDYVARIIRRMKLDNVVVACGTDPATPKISPIVPGMMIDAKWFSTRPISPAVLPFLNVESIINGHPFVVYTTILLHYKRPFGRNYGSDVWAFRGKNHRMRGSSFWWILSTFLYTFRWSFLWGYISYSGVRLSKQHSQYINNVHMASLKRKLGLKQQILLDTEIGLFVLPKDYGKDHPLPPNRNDE